MATIKKIKTKEAGNSLVNDATPVYRARSKSISGKALKRNACYTLCNISKVPLPNMNISPYHSVLKNRGKAQFKVGYHFEFNAFEFYCSTCGLYFQTLDLYHEHVMIRERFINMLSSIEFEFPFGIWDVCWDICDVCIDPPYGYYPHTAEGRISETVKESKFRKYYDRKEFMECYNIIKSQIKSDLHAARTKFTTASSNEQILDLDKLKDFEKDMERLKMLTESRRGSRDSSMKGSTDLSSKRESSLALRSYMSRISKANVGPAISDNLEKRMSKINIRSSTVNVRPSTVNNRSSITNVASRSSRTSGLHTNKPELKQVKTDSILESVEDIQDTQYNNSLTSLLSKL